MIATSRPPAMNCEDCGREIGEREFHIILILSTKLAGWLVCCECARQVEPGKGAEDEALACSRAKAAAHLLGWEPPGEGGLRASHNALCGPLILRGGRQSQVVPYHGDR